jgi:hypothetical protein
MSIPTIVITVVDAEYECRPPRSSHPHRIYALSTSGGRALNQETPRTQREASRGQGTLQHRACRCASHACAGPMPTRARPRGSARHAARGRTRADRRLPRGRCRAAGHPTTQAPRHRLHGVQVTGALLEDRRRGRVNWRVAVRRARRRPSAVMSLAGAHRDAIDHGARICRRFDSRERPSHG